MNSEKASFSALLMAGGRSSRFGSDKALLPWAGQPLWQHQLQTLSCLQPTQLLLACRAEQEGLIQARVDRVFLDPPTHRSGPLGILTHVLAEMARPVLVLAIDMPCMTAAYLQEAILSCLDHPTVPQQLTDGFFEPLCALYTPALLPLMQQQVAAGQLGLQQLWQLALAAGLAKTVGIQDAERPLFQNANTLNDWLHMQKTAALAPTQEPTPLNP
jgi:molybdenum cofactor guanylyltransferase